MRASYTYRTCSSQHLWGTLDPPGEGQGVDQGAHHQDAGGDLHPGASAQACWRGGGGCAPPHTFMYVGREPRQKALKPSALKMRRAASAPTAESGAWQLA